MAIRYMITTDGGFLAGDLDRGIADYAYPTSAYAEQAKRAPRKAAAAMLESATADMLTTPFLVERNNSRLFTLRQIGR